MGNTKIQWAEKVWNPVTGCTKVSSGCQNCYAERMAKNRLKGRYGYSENDPFGVTLHPDSLAEPLHWKKPSRIFVCSMGDLFHEDVDDGFLCRVFDTMLVAEQHTFLVLTKRPERMEDFITRCVRGKPKNIWLGVTAENQEQADKRIPILLQIPAAVRFVSVEPMLGPVNLTSVIYERVVVIDALNELCGWPTAHAPFPDGCKKLDWVICGGESGPGARPAHPDWVRGLRDQCQAAGVPFLFKQWGEWLSQWDMSNIPGTNKQVILNGLSFYKVGKKKAGRLLDGREWDEYPEVLL